MKIFAFIILVVAAIAEEKNIKQEMHSLEFEREIVQMCLHDTQMTVDELMTAQEQLKNIQYDSIDSIDDETKKSLKKNSRFTVCVLEKTEQMKDSKLNVDEIIEVIGESKTKLPINKDNMKKCLNALNDNDRLTREDRALGMSICIVADDRNRNMKK